MPTIRPNPNVKEEWLDVAGLEGVYQVSNHGRVFTMPRTVEYSGGAVVRQRRGKELATTVKKTGVFVQLTDRAGKKRRYRVSTLVRRAFGEEYFNRLVAAQRGLAKGVNTEED